MNGSTNSTDSTDSSYTEGLTLFALVVCSVVFFVGVIGNGLVLLVFGSRLSRLKSFEIYLVSLGAADLLASLMIPSKMFYDLVGGSYEYGGTFGCIMVNTLCTGSITVSCLTLVVISLNRYIVVKWPLREYQSRCVLTFVIFSTWVIGILSAMGMYTVKGRVILTPLETTVVCHLNFETGAEFKGYGVTVFAGQSGLPLLSMSVLYGLIIYELKKTAKITLFQNCERMLNSVYQRNRKSIRVLVALLVVFIICTTPEKLSYVVYTFRRESIDHDQWRIIYILLALLLMVNHCINPIIYAKLHTSFRRHTFNLLCKCRIFECKNIRDGFQSIILRNNNQTFLTVNYSVTSQYNAGHRVSEAIVAAYQLARDRIYPDSPIGSPHKQTDSLLEKDSSQSQSPQEETHL